MPRRSRPVPLQAESKKDAPEQNELMTTTEYNTLVKAARMRQFIVLGDVFFAFALVRGVYWLMKKTIKPYAPTLFSWISPVYKAITRPFMFFGFASTISSFPRAAFVEKERALMLSALPAIYLYFKLPLEFVDKLVFGEYPSSYKGSDLDHTTNAI